MAKRTGTLRGWFRYEVAIIAPVLVAAVFGCLQLGFTLQAKLGQYTTGHSSQASGPALPAAPMVLMEFRIMSPVPALPDATGEGGL